MFTAISLHVWYNKESDEAKQAAQQQQQFATTLQTLFQNQYAQASASQQYLLNRLSGVFARANAGQGFGNNELATLRTNNQEDTANAAQQATQATARRLQQLSGGGTLPSGAAGQILGQANTAVANQGAAGLRNINLANSQLARQTATNTAGQLAGLTGQGLQAAGGLLGGTVGQGSNAYGAIEQAYKPSNFWGNLGQGLLSGGLNALSGGITGGISSLGNIFKGGGGYQGGNYDEVGG